MIGGERRRRKRMAVIGDIVVCLGLTSNEFAIDGFLVNGEGRKLG